MNIAIWIAQGLLAFAFLFAGLMKLAKSRTEMKPKLGDWVDDLSDGQMKVVGLLEFLGAVGLILPMLLGIMSWLTWLAALGLCLTMIGAMALHLKRGEMDKLPPNVFLFALSAFVFIGRFFLVSV